jgi:hypothetical protein
MPAGNGWWIYGRSGNAQWASRDGTGMGTPSYGHWSGTRRPFAVAALVAALLVAPGAGARKTAVAVEQAPAAAGECGLPAASPLWIDYAEGSVKPDVRAVLSKPGVVVATSGAALGATFRKAGFGTTYFELPMPRIVGETDAPADAASIIPATDALYAKAVATTDCATPWIALNELQGSSLAVPWQPSYAAYRANVLTLLQRLAERGAQPALLVHGNPTVAGETALWWQTASKSAHIIYEAYYDAAKMHPLGSLIASRRMRIGMRNVIVQFEGAGVPRTRLGFMLGFHSAQTPGIAGRQGLEPAEAWLRVVKWETFAANQVAREYGIRTLWSWGWGTFGADSVDEDKAVAACTWLWARNPSLCDAPAMAGSTFESSRTEGQLAVPRGVTCTFANGGRVYTSAVERLAKLTKDRHDALTAEFARAALAGAAHVDAKSVLAIENRAIKNAFKGSRAAYEKALAKRGATVEVARGLIGDELRRRGIARNGLDGAPTMFDRLSTIETAAVDSAICLGDFMPGVSEPISRGNAVDVGTVPLLRKLPFLFRHTLAPNAPIALTATRSAQTVTLRWTSGSENDLAGYEVYRTTPGGAPERLNDHLVGRSTFVDAPSPAGTTYTIRAVDTSGNASGWTAPIAS